MAEKNADDAAKLLEGIAVEIDHVTDSELLEVGHVATKIVLERTAKGLDADLQPFAPYQPDYAAERAQSGLSTQPNLSRTGKMLSAMVPVVAGKDDVTIRFTDDRESTKAAANNSGVDAVGASVARGEQLSYMRQSSRPKQARRETPKREFVDVRAAHEVEAVGEAIVHGVAKRIEKKINQ